MDNIEKEALKTIWNYMVLNQELTKCDLIIGCGCYDKQIPVLCAELLKAGYAPKIIFTGGLGKITQELFPKSEAETYRDIAVSCGVDPEKILIENKSTNTGDNFKFSAVLIAENNLKANKILIVHRGIYQRRTLNVAKTILRDSEIFITAPPVTFEEFITFLEHSTDEEVERSISVIVGNIQRLIIYPQFGWQTEEEIPLNVLKAYKILKEMGYDKYIYKKEDIKKLIKTHGLEKGREPNYFN